MEAVINACRAQGLACTLIVDPMWMDRYVGFEDGALVVNPGYPWHEDPGMPGPQRLSIGGWLVKPYHYFFYAAHAYWDAGTARAQIEFVDWRNDTSTIPGDNYSLRPVGQVARARIFRHRRQPRTISDSSDQRVLVRGILPDQLLRDKHSAGFWQLRSSGLRPDLYRLGLEILTGGVGFLLLRRSRADPRQPLSLRNTLDDMVLAIPGRWVQRPAGDRLCRLLVRRLCGRIPVRLRGDLRHLAVPVGGRA